MNREIKDSAKYINNMVDQNHEEGKLSEDESPEDLYSRTISLTVEKQGFFGGIFRK